MVFPATRRSFSGWLAIVLIQFPAFRQAPAAGCAAPNAARLTLSCMKACLREGSNFLRPRLPIFFRSIRLNNKSVSLSFTVNGATSISRSVSRLGDCGSSGGRRAALYKNDSPIQYGKRRAESSRGIQATAYWKDSNLRVNHLVAGSAFRFHRLALKITTNVTPPAANSASTAHPASSCTPPPTA